MTIGPNATHFDRIASLAHQKFNSLAGTVMESMVGKKVLAALVMKTRADDVGRVVSLGLGEPCFVTLTSIWFLFLLILIVMLKTWSEFSTIINNSAII